MKRFTTIFIAIFFCLSISSFAQVVDFKEVSMERLIEIVKAEDELRYDKTLEDFMKSPNPFLRKRAALAAGRIGNEDAIPTLTNLLMKDTEDVKQMAAFALGEIESIKAADAILDVLKDKKNADIVREKAIEAAGKIAAANSKDGKAKSLGEAILDNLEFENNRGKSQNKGVILMGITASLRAKPDEADYVVAKFLTNMDWRIRADAGNALARLGAKKANKQFQAMLLTDENPIARANAVRALGAAEDKTAINLILEAALTDTDLRVRINAIRALGSLKEIGTANKLFERSEKLFAEYKKSKYENPIEENELLTLASTLGNILKGTDNARAVKFLDEFRKLEKHTSPEVEIALIRISPSAYAETVLPKKLEWKGGKGFVAGLEEAANLEESKDVKELQSWAKMILGSFIKNTNEGKEPTDKLFPDILSAYAKFKVDGLVQVLQDSLKQDDVIIRSTAASLLGDTKPGTPAQSATVYAALSEALWKARTDKLNDASLAILDALKKQYENRPPQKIKIAYMTPFISAIESPDYLIRRKAAEIYKGFNLKKPNPKEVGDPDFKLYEIPKDIGVVKFTGETDKNGARSRVVRTDYKSALSRKNGEWVAILKTDKGEFTIDFFPEEAPLTVDNFIKLAQSGYFNGLAIHRVVPNFVMQDGDPRGDGNGGPGWQIRCEINQIQYERGMVGMALSGKDTGGSQWFVTHSPQPHLDGGYTIFGKVNETGMKIVDNLARGDKIISVNIIRAAPGK